MNSDIELPAGFVLRPMHRLASSTTKATLATRWAWMLRVLLDAGADANWISSKDSPFRGGEASALLNRGALLIAEKGSKKVYRLTEKGVKIAREYPR